MTDQIAKGEVSLGGRFAEHRIRGYVYHAVGKGIDPNLDVPLVLCNDTFENWLRSLD